VFVIATAPLPVPLRYPSITPPVPPEWITQERSLRKDAGFGDSSVSFTDSVSQLNRETDPPGGWRGLTWIGPTSLRITGTVFMAGIRPGAARTLLPTLATLDLSGFDPKAPPPKTAAFWEIVDAGRAPEQSELDDLLDLIGRPDVVTISRLAASADGSFAEWLRDRRNKRQIPHRLEDCGYLPVRNDTAKDGLWRINGRREAVLARPS
jgi:hypothetical protein